MKKIIVGLLCLLLMRNVEAMGLNVKIAPQMTNCGHAVHTELTASDFYGKGIIEAGLEKDIGSDKVPNPKVQVIHFLPRHFSVGSLIRLGLDDKFNPDNFLYASLGPGYSFAHGKAKASLAVEANVPIQEGRFGNPGFGITGYADYELAKGIKVYAVGSASKGFQLARVGANVSFPMFYR